MNHARSHCLNDEFDVQRFNEDWYARRWTAFQESAQRMYQEHGLPACLDMLISQQLDAGFIQDDLRAVTRCRLVDPEDNRRGFHVQFNPVRAQRHSGAGRQSRIGSPSVNNGCFLCRENFSWQQRFMEIGFELDLQNTSYVALPNPFPFRPSHCIVATARHVAQCWQARPAETILTDLLDLARQLPGFVALHNGDGAGATIPLHAHIHCVRRLHVTERLPLEVAADVTTAGAGPALVPNYPIAVITMRGRAREIVAAISPLVDRWRRLCGAAATANFIATRVDDTDQDLHFYFVPRNKHLSRAPGMTGLVAGLEVLGEIVLSTQQERELLETGRIDFEYVDRILSSVQPPEITEFFDGTALHTAQSRSRLFIGKS